MPVAGQMLAVGADGIVVLADGAAEQIDGAAEQVDCAAVQADLTIVIEDFNIRRKRRGIISQTYFELCALYFFFSPRGVLERLFAV